MLKKVFSWALKGQHPCIPLEMWTRGFSWAC